MYQSQYVGSLILRVIIWLKSGVDPEAVSEYRAGISVKLGSLGLVPYYKPKTMPNARF